MRNNSDTRQLLSGRALGLRSRIVVRFAAVALFLSVLLGVITHISVRQLIIEDRRASSVEQATGDARLVAATLRSGQANPSDVLVSMRPPTRSTPLLFLQGQWFAASLQVRPEDLPQGLADIVLGGTAARQTIYIGERPVSVVGVPLADDLGFYFEVFSLADVSNTLSTLLQVLVLAGVVATIAGALLGGLIARRVLRPLRDVTEVAQLIASGELESRLDEGIDRDLAILTASFNRMADTLQTRIAREARFASDVAHELRTPLTTLITSLSVLERRRGELSPEGGEALDLLGRDVRRLERTTADLVEMAKHDAGVVTADIEPLPATTVINRLLNRLRRADLPVVVDQEAVRSLVHADEGRLERILINLIDNADKHGGGTTRITVSRVADVVRIAVEDRGPGVLEEDRTRVFDRFARGTNARPSGRYDGSGLGLALAAENTVLQGGSIWVEEAPGGGARFVVELPAETA
ncbi:MAG TPA: HAMP domain-containing sensor histidine kinase [Acidimicrobiia bacterium]|nr:HAMP domain-containing sensor histidine kinase [Acidimicrobiia bacterium]